MIFSPRFLVLLALACALPTCALPPCVWSQDAAPAAPVAARSGSLFPLVTPASAQALANGQPIALDLRDATLLEVLSALEKQSAVPMTFGLDAETLATKLSVDIDTPSFYEAFAAIGRAAKVPLKLRHYSPNQPWEVTAGAARPDYAPRVVQGLFSLGLSSLNHRRSDSLDWRLDFEQMRDAQAARAELPRVESMGAANELNLIFDPRPDPRLPIAGPARIQITRAQDEQGRALQTLNPREKYSVYLWTNTVWSERETRAALTPPAPDARKLAHLEGHVIYVFAAARDRWEVPDALNSRDLTREFGAPGQKFRAEIKKIERDGDDIDVTIELTNDNPEAWGELGSPLFSIAQAAQWMRIEDANGIVLRSRYGNSTDRKKVADKITFSASDRRARQGKTELMPPFKFIFDAPTDWVQTEVPFAFENVPLP